MDVLSARSFVPYKLKEDLRQWLTQAPLAGGFRRMAAAHHGQIHVPAGNTTSRRFELVADFSDTQVRYKDGWPTLNAGAGSLCGRSTDICAVMKEKREKHSWWRGSSRRCQ